MLLCPAELLETSHKPHSFPPRNVSPLSEAYLLVSSDHEPLSHHPWLKKKITVDHPGPAHGRSVGGQVGVRRCTSLIGEPQVLKGLKDWSQSWAVPASSSPVAQGHREASPTALSASAVRPPSAVSPPCMSRSRAVPADKQPMLP